MLQSLINNPFGMYFLAIVVGSPIFYWLWKNDAEARRKVNAPRLKREAAQAAYQSALTALKASPTNRASRRASGTKM